MPGELGGGPVDTLAAEGLDVRRVQTDPLAGQEVVVRRLREQGVPEGVAVRTETEQHVLLHGRPQRPVELVLVLADHGGEQPVAHPAARAGGGPDDLPGTLVQPVEPDQQQVGEVLGDAALTAVRGGADQLLGEERVALGAMHDRVHLPLRQRPGQQRTHQAGHVEVGEGVELEPLHRGHPRPLREVAAERVTPVQVVGAVGRDHADRRAEPPGEQEGEQVTRGPVGPVHVLDDEQDRLLLGEHLQGTVDGPEELTTVEVLLVDRQRAREQPPAGLEVGQRRVGLDQGLHEPRLLDRHAAEQLGERKVGQGAVAEVETVPDQAPPARAGGPGDELVQEPGLADAGVAGEQHGPGLRVTAEAELLGQVRELPCTPQEGRHGIGFGGHMGHHLAEDRQNGSDFPCW